MCLCASLSLGPFAHEPCNHPESMAPGRLGKSTVTLLFSVCTALFVRSAIAASATCVFKDLASYESCPAFATARALEFLDVGDDAVIFIDADMTERTSVVTSIRVEQDVSLAKMDEDEGLLLEREVLELSGARYELPISRLEVLKQLGFPKDTEIATEDWPEMIRVHAETVLSISAIASRFLLEQAGLSGTEVGAEVDAVVHDAARTLIPGALQPANPADVPALDPIVVETH
jgi:hypothetical protein